MAKVKFLMRVITGDVTGKCRITDLWTDTTIARFGGNKDDQSDRDWNCGAITLYEQTKACVLHDSGYASFCDIENQTRTGFIQIPEAKKAHFIAAYETNFIGCFDGKCAVFNSESVVSSFDTIQGSCATYFDGKVCYGRIEDRAQIYDVTNGNVIWTSAVPPNDELGIALEDKDRSLLFMDSNLLIVGQQEGNTLLYDIRAGNEAQKRFKPFPEFPIVTLCKINDSLFACGDTIGSITIQELKMENGLNIEGFKGFKGAPAGNVAICAHETLPVIAALTYDRCVRMYDYSRSVKTPQKTAFVRTLSNCMLFMNDDKPEEIDSSENEWDELPEDGEGIWDNFVPCPQAKRPNEDI